MCLAVVLLFLAAVIGEVASIVIVASHVGASYTFLALAVTAGLGALLLMGRAAATLRAAGKAWADGQPVGEVLVASALAALAGVLLVFPGFLSDAIALIILVPPMRARLAGRMAARLRARAQVVVAQAQAQAQAQARGRQGGAPGDVIDAEGVELRDPEAPDVEDGPDGPRLLP